MINLESVGKNVAHNGVFTKKSPIISPLSSYTFEIQLPRKDFKQGIVKWHATGSTGSSRQKIVFVGFINRKEDETHSLATDVKTYSLYGYLFDAWHLKGYVYNEDSKLSVNEYNYTGIPGGAWTCYVKSVYIEGDKIKITFYNPGTANSSGFDIAGTYQVWT